MTERQSQPPCARPGLAPDAADPGGTTRRAGRFQALTAHRAGRFQALTARRAGRFCCSRKSKEASEPPEGSLRAFDDLVLDTARRCNEVDHKAER